MKDEEEGAFAPEIHKDIISEVIEENKIIFEQEIINDLLHAVSVEADYPVVGGYTKDYHFDNIDGSGRDKFESIKKRFDKIVIELDSILYKIKNNDGKLKDNIISFGIMLHNVEDFYAHSNYVRIYQEYYQKIEDPEFVIIDTDGKFKVDKTLPENILIPIFFDGINNSQFYKFLTRVEKDTANGYTFPKGLYTGIYNGVFADKNTKNPNDHGYINLDEADKYDDPLKSRLGYHAKKTAKEHTRIYLEKLSETLKNVKK